MLSPNAKARLSLAWVGAGLFLLASTGGLPGADNQLAPELDMIIPEAGSVLRELYSVEIHFNQPVQGVDAADLLINGAPATNVTQVAEAQFVFVFPPPADGVVTVAWRADHGITDLSDPPRPWIATTWTYTLDSLNPAPGVIISEFMADNRKTLHDEDGDNSDWLEIYNPETTPANLEGWFLTDDRNNLAKWRFPNITIPGQSYLVVFASGKDKTNVTGRLHTNFKLAAEGGYLALVTPAITAISEFEPAYPPQLADVSYGRVEGEPRLVGYFSKPTPGQPNSNTGADFAPGVEFSRVSGPFTTRFELALAPSTAGVVIRYTLDGSLPTNSSPVYVTPIVVTNSLQVRARAFQEGMLPGPPRSETYLLLNANVIGFNSDLPVMVIHTLGKGAPSSSRLTSAHVSVFEPLAGRTSLTNSPAAAFRAGIALRGSSTEGLAKASYKLELWDEFNNDADHEVLGLPADSDWVLYAPNQFEPVLIHNPLVHQLSRDMGRYSPRTRFLELYINKTTGAIATTHYAGIYVLEEKIKIGSQRVNIDKLQPEHAKPPEVTGGYLLKIDRLDPGDSGLSAGGALMAYVDPKEREIKIPQRLPQRNYISNYFRTFSSALNGANWRDPKLGYSAYFDVEAAIDFHVLEVLSGNVDALVLSTYFHKPRNGKIVFGPHWDFDRALGSTDGRDANPRIWTTGPFFGAAWWTRLFTDIDFWQRWVDRWQELRTRQFALGNLHGLIDKLANEVRQAQPREYQKWRVSLRGGSYQSEVNLLKNWVSNRIDFIDRQLAQPPRFSLAEGSILPDTLLTISGPTNATIYFTLDGSDPRNPLGGISSKATAYAQPIRLQANARVVARSRDPNKRQSGGPPANSSTPWSGPVAATLVITTPPLLITEIMFQPSSTPVGGTNSSADMEYIELKNTGSVPLNLPGYHVSGCIDYAFSTAGGITNLLPGERIVLVKNQAAFQARYPAVTNVAGEFSGTLGTSDHHLVLTGPLLEPILDFTFQNDWARLADGLGFSMVLADEAAPFNELGDGTRWRASAQIGGSPGLPEPPRPSLPPVYVNEVVSNPRPAAEDAVELFNDSWMPADISGWWLSDNFREPKKYRVPTASILSGKGILVFYKSQFHAWSTNGFALSALGDSVYLFSADAQGELTGWYHGFAFGPQEQGMSFGRWLTSDGREHFVPYLQPTLGEPNPAPEIWPAAFSEIMYAPAAADRPDTSFTSFIELADLTRDALPLALFDPSNPGQTWRIRGSVEYDFPPGFRFPQGRLVVVVGFDPVLNPEAMTQFRTRYRLDSSVTILGPWRGALNPTGGILQLFKPLPSSQTVNPSFALVEEIHYLSQAPWPSDAAGTGRSIVPAFPRFFGDEPCLWISAPPTPGDLDSDGDGLPDRWKIAHGLDPLSATGINGLDGDPDHDGFTNYQEYLADTDPHDPLSLPRLEVFRDAEGGTRLVFAAGPSRVYIVLYRDEWGGGDWHELATLIAPINGGLMSLRDPTPNAQRFYRLQIR